MNIEILFPTPPFPQHITPKCLLQTDSAEMQPDLMLFVQRDDSRMRHEVIVLDQNGVVSHHTFRGIQMHLAAVVVQFNAAAFNLGQQVVKFH